MTDSAKPTQVCLTCRGKFGQEHSHCPEDGTELVPTHKDQMIGTIFAEKYEILSVAGKGGMSTVYKARHNYMERLVAVKVLHQHLVSDTLSVQRFRQEAKAASSLSHPNIITVFDFGITENGQAFLVMDYLDGHSLSDLLGKSGALPEQEAIDIIRQTARGLLHAHNKGVVHRDLKPANLVLKVSEDGSILVKIVDFGIAKMAPSDGQASQHLTQTGEVFGSPLYMSPEQCEGGKVDKRSDIYSFGCLIYELVCGVPPLIGENAVDTMALHINTMPMPVNELDTAVKISEELEEVISRCLEKNPAKRFDSVVGIIEALSHMDHNLKETTQSNTVALHLNNLVATQESEEGSTSTRHSKKRQKTRFKISNRQRANFLAITLVLLVGFIALYQGPNEDPGSPLAKMTWQLELSFSEMLLKAGLYGVAMPVLEFSTWHSENLDPILKRPNYEKRIQTLAKLAEVYNASGKASLYEKTIKSLTTLDRQRWTKRAKDNIAELDQAQDYIDELTKRREPIQSHLSEAVLNWAASVKSVVEIARRLDANYAYELEYQLLVKTESVITELYGKNFVGLAEIKLQKAICLQNQDRITDIDQIDDDKSNRDGIYGRIAEIYAYNVKKQLGLDEDATLSMEQISQEPEYIRALLKLGQWQRRRNRFEEAGKNTSLAVQAAQKYNKFEPDALAEFYSSYANYLYQTGKLDQSQKYRDMARQERQKSAEQMGLKYIEHKK